MKQKKTISPFTQKLHIFAQNVSDAKIILGAIIVIFGTLTSVAFGAINYVIAIQNAPIIERVEAIESRDISIEKALVGLENANKETNSKLDTLLLKLVPNYNVGTR